MDHVFLSYSQKDKAGAARLETALERKGLCVWRDKDLTPGENWQREIPTVLQSVPCAIVYWTPQSIASNYVLAEAYEAWNQSKLVPVLGEDAVIPVPYSGVQAADLRNWNGEDDHPEFVKVLQGIRRRLEKAGVPVPPALLASTHEINVGDTPRKTFRTAPYLWLAAPTALALVLAIVLMEWRVPSEIDIDVPVKLVRFQVESDKPEIVLEPAGAQWIGIRGFDWVRLEPAVLWRADPALYDFDKDSFPDKAWIKQPPSPELALRRCGVRGTSNVSFKPISPPNGSLRLDRLFTGPSDVTIRVSDDASLAVDLRGTEREGVLELAEEVRINADLCQGDGLPFTLRVRLDRERRLAKYAPASSGIAFNLVFPTDTPASLLGKAGVPVRSIRFSDQGPDGQPLTTIAGAGTITFDDSADALKLTPDDALIVDGLHGFRLLHASLEKNVLRVRAQGTADILSVGTPGHIRDRRLSKFAVLSHSPAAVALFGTCWAVLTIVGIVKFRKA
jgi:hypothetical protein